ncbi:MAG: hypothetical protein KY475_24315 [Planctomycetes bacterium]|nr:hypothetical protein [Planctomycetota bacterium]
MRNRCATPEPRDSACAADCPAHQPRRASVRFFSTGADCRATPAIV